MNQYIRGRPRAGPEGTGRPQRESPELVDWLRSGRLTLLDERREVVDAEAWHDLPAGVRARALAQFDRVVSPNAKAAILYL